MNTKSHNAIIITSKDEKSGEIRNAITNTGIPEAFLSKIEEIVTSNVFVDGAMFCSSAYRTIRFDEDVVIARTVAYERDFAGNPTSYLTHIILLDGKQIENLNFDVLVLKDAILSEPSSGKLKMISLKPYFEKVDEIKSPHRLTEFADEASKSIFDLLPPNQSISKRALSFLIDSLLAKQQVYLVTDNKELSIEFLRGLLYLIPSIIRASVFVSSCSANPLTDSAYNMNLICVPKSVFKSSTISKEIKPNAVIVNLANLSTTIPSKYVPSPYADYISSEFFEDPFNAYLDVFEVERFLKEHKKTTFDLNLVEKIVKRNSLEKEIKEHLDANEPEEAVKTYFELFKLDMQLDEILAADTQRKLLDLVKTLQNDELSLECLRLIAENNLKAQVDSQFIRWIMNEAINIFKDPLYLDKFFQDIYPHMLQNVSEATSYFINFIRQYWRKLDLNTISSLFFLTKEKIKELVEKEERYQTLLESFEAEYLNFLTEYQILPLIQNYIEKEWFEKINRIAEKRLTASFEMINKFNDWFAPFVKELTPHKELEELVKKIKSFVALKLNELAKKFLSKGEYDKAFAIYLMADSYTEETEVHKTIFSKLLENLNVNRLQRERLGDEFFNNLREIVIRLETYDFKDLLRQYLDLVNTLMTTKNYYDINMVDFIARVYLTQNLEESAVRLVEKAFTYYQTNIDKFIEFASDLATRQIVAKNESFSLLVYKSALTRLPVSHIHRLYRSLFNLLTKLGISAKDTFLVFLNASYNEFESRLDKEVTIPEDKVILYSKFAEFYDDWGSSKELNDIVEKIKNILISIDVTLTPENMKDLNIIYERFFRTPEQLKNYLALKLKYARALLVYKNLPEQQRLSEAAIQLKIALSRVLDAVREGQPFSDFKDSVFEMAKLLKSFKKLDEVILGPLYLTYIEFLIYNISESAEIWPILKNMLKIQYKLTKDIRRYCWHLKSISSMLSFSPKLTVPVKEFIDLSEKHIKKCLSKKSREYYTTAIALIKELTKVPYFKEELMRKPRKLFVKVVLTALKITPADALKALEESEVLKFYFQRDKKARERLVTQLAILRGNISYRNQANRIIDKYNFRKYI